MATTKEKLRNATILSLDIVEEMRNVLQEEEVVSLIDALETEYQNILNLNRVTDSISVIRSTLNDMKVKAERFLDKIAKLEGHLTEIETYNAQL